MVFEHDLKNKKAVIFGLDNVLYPEKDYLLQVYYLFSEFMSYTEQLAAKEILAFMTEEYTAHGEISIFDKTAEKFNINQKYKENFILLHQNARLPLKLLLYQQVLTFLQALVVERINIFLLVDGKPEIQINKIKQLEWHGLEQHLKVFFTEEFEAKPSIASLEFIIQQHQYSTNELLIVGLDKKDEQFAATAGIDFLNLKNLLQ